MNDKVLDIMTIVYYNEYDMEIPIEETGKHPAERTRLCVRSGDQINTTEFLSNCSLYELSGRLYDFSRRIL